jgi:hypothetical protein
VKFEIKKDIIWKPGIPPEKMAEILQEFNKRISGLEQNLKGLAKRNAADGFLQLFPDHSRRQIEDDIVRLNSLNDLTRFRTDALLMFAEWLVNGMAATGDEEFLGKFKKWAEEWNVKTGA